MKNDREFLDGVYKKAELLKTEKNKTRTLYIKYSSLAAVFLLVVTIPFIMFRDQNIDKNKEAENHEPQMIRMMGEPRDNFTESDYIVIAKIEKKLDNHEEFMDIEVSIEEILRGEIKGKEIVLSVPSYLSDEFKIGDKNLLFLYSWEDKYSLLDDINSQFEESKKDEFRDKQGNQYSLKDIKNKIKGED